jgi:hypothetical protein
MTKKSPPVTAAERTWLTKPPYKRHKNSNVPVPTLQAAAPTAAPMPVPLVTIAPVCVKLHTLVHFDFAHMEQKITSTTPQHNLKHNCAP